jgi:CDP-glycerol glycerophosphotransferase
VKLSVVVPAYNAERYLARCLDSLLRDGSADIEVVAVDDASPDDSAKLLDEYAAADARLTVVHLDTNRGLGGARNAGLDRATGEYVWFVDADDWLPDGTIPAVLERLGQTAPDVLVVDHEEVFEDGRIVPAARPRADKMELLRLAQSACTRIVRRAFLDETGLRFADGWYEDVSYSHPLMMAAQRIDVLDRVSYCYWQHAEERTGAITKTTSARHFEVFDQYERLFAGMTPDQERFRPVLFRVMIDHYLVVVGNDRRLPDALRKPFFRRMARDYRRWRPAGGYPVPGGVAGLKHRLVRHDLYGAWAALRAAYRLRSAQPRRAQHAPGQDAGPPGRAPAAL